MDSLIGRICHFISFYSRKWDGPKYYTTKKTFDCPRKLCPINARDDLSAVLGLLHDERILNLDYAGKFLHLSNFSSFPEYINKLVQKRKIRLELWVYSNDSSQQLQKFDISKYIPNKDEDRKIFAFFRD